MKLNTVTERERLAAMRRHWRYQEFKAGDDLEYSHKLTAHCYDLRGMVFNEEHVTSADYVHCDFTGTTAKNSIFLDSSFCTCDFAGVKCDDVDFSLCVFKACTFRNATFVNCNFEDAIFCITDEEEDFKGATFKGCNLKDSGLEGLAEERMQDET